MLLVPHPDHSSPWQVMFDARQDGGQVQLTYRIAGPVDRLALPPPTAGERRDELWRHTCYEWFVADRQGSGYTEWNFAPSGDWACYHFDDHRTGMRAGAVGSAPIMHADTANDELLVTVSLDADVAAGSSFNATAVLEDTDGSRVFHALAHPPGAPDFHARACFIGRLGGREGA